MGKSLSCIAATSTIGAVAVIPKVKSTLFSLEKEINPLESATFTNLVDVTSTITTNTQEQINSALQKIAKWLKDNGGCKIKLAIKAGGGEYHEVKGEEETIDTNHPLFQPQSGMGGKSKFQRLADDLNEENKRKGEDATKYSKYKEEFKKRCESKNNQFIKLQWRGKVSEEKKDEDKTYSENLKGLMNLWVDEKEDAC